MSPQSKIYGDSLYQQHQHLCESVGACIEKYFMAKTPRIYIPPAVKKYVFERDRYQCQSCGKTQLETKLTIDHIIPLARGGKMTSVTYKLFAVAVTYRINTTSTPDSAVTLVIK